MNATINPYATITELGTLLREKKITSVQLTRFYLDRLERFGPKLNAVVTMTRELAEAQAKQADKDIAAGSWHGPLHGIPYGVKDLLATKGIPTTWGAAPYRNQVFEYDATVIERLTRGGAVLCAKLAMVELAGGFGYDEANASFTGPGRSPWNTEFWSGGSSSGPGAAVGAGLVPFAIGSETSGSILTPSAFSGVTGFRPTYGMVSRHGAMALSWTLDKLGPLARTAEDCALIMAEIAGRDPADPTTVEAQIEWLGPFRATHSESDGRTVAIPKGCTEKVQKEVRENFEKSVGVLKQAGYRFVEIEFPDFPYGAISPIVDAEGASAFEDLLTSGKAKELTAPQDRIGGYEAAATLAIDYLRAMRIRTRIRQAMLQLFEDVDLIAAPTRASVAYPIAKKFDQVYPDVRSGVALIPAMNLAGAPAISLPNGLGENGLPTAIQFNAAPLHDVMAIEAGKALQRVTDFHRQKPPAFS
ncbi:MAG: amidase [Thermoanaerobaculia bacterium]